MKNRENINDFFPDDESDKCFQPPEGYFNSFNEKVFNRIRRKEEKYHQPETRIWRIIRPQLAFAAGLTGLAFVLYSGIHFILRENENTFSSSPYISELIQYELNNINEDLLFDIIASGENINDNYDEMDDIIIEYLINSNIDYNSLFKEL